MHFKTLILGGGISGLILSYYLKVPIVSKNLGGQLTQRQWHLGPKYLHVDEASSRLLHDLGLSMETETITCGYDFNGRCKHTPEFRQEYYEKTRKTKKNYIPSSMNAGKNKFESYSISLMDIIQTLKNEMFGARGLMYIPWDVKSIDLVNKILILDDGELTQITFDKLISTIPAPVFMKIANVDTNESFDSLKKTFILKDEKTEFEEYFIYYAGNEPYHRLTKQGKKTVYEYVEYDSEVDWEDAVKKKVNPDNIAEVWIGQIIDSKKNLSVKGVTFVGRYAEWKHNFLINDAVRKALEMMESKYFNS